MILATGLIVCIQQDKHRHANPAKNQTGNDGPKQDDHFASLFPQRLVAVNQSPQQVDWRMF